MMTTESFRAFVLEQLSALDNLRCKRMFGGHGLHFGEIFFGIVFDGRLYFKTNPGTLPDFLAFDAAVFTPSENRVLKNYREVQADIHENVSKLTTWAQKATCT